MITAAELRAHFGRRGLTLLQQHRLDQLRKSRETPRYITVCAWCETTPPPQAHVVYTHICCATCQARIEKEG